METKLIKIGNSRGVRLPSQLLLDFEENVEFEVKKEGDNLVLSPIKSSRAHWVEQMKKEKPDENDFVLNDFDQTEWEW